jgi:hypothetical protein
MYFLVKKFIVEKTPKKNKKLFERYNLMDSVKWGAEKNWGSTQTS